MKNALLTFLAVLLGCGLALFIYHRYILEPRLQQTESRERVALDAARAEAEAIAAELEASAQESVRTQREAANALVERDNARRKELAAEGAALQRQALAAEALTRAGMVRVAIAEHYLSTGQWPSRLDELGLGEPEDHAGGPVRAIRLGEKGEIVIEIATEVADDASLHLVPAASPVGSIEWRCRAERFEDARRLPACRQ